MKDKIRRTDEILAKVTVCGDNLMYIAIARQWLKEVYEELNKESENG